MVPGCVVGVRVLIAEVMVFRQRCINWLASYHGNGFLPELQSQVFLYFVNIYSSLLYICQGLSSKMHATLFARPLKVHHVTRSEAAARGAEILWQARKKVLGTRARKNLERQASDILNL